MVNINPEIEQSWKVVLLKEFNKDYFIKLKQFLMDEKNTIAFTQKEKTSLMLLIIRLLTW